MGIKNLNNYFIQNFMNLNTKMAAAGLILAFGTVVLLGAGCASKVANLTGGQLTDEDKCIEFMAYALLAPQYGQNVAALTVLQQKLDGLKTKYGWSDEDISRICEPIVKQQGFMDRVAPRMQKVLTEIK